MKKKNSLTKFEGEANNPMRNIKWLKQDGEAGFHYLAGINRAIIPGQVSKLAKSVEKMGTIRPIVIAVLSFITGRATKYIVDGQHLYNALIRLGAPIPYVTIEISSKKELVEKIALLNSSSKSWSLKDYVTAWSSLVDDYVKLNKYFQIYDLEISVLASILSNYSGGSSSVANRRLKSGEFRIVDEADNVKILDYLTDALKVAPRMNRFENKYFCSEFVTFVRGKGARYNHQRFMDYISVNKKQLMLATQEEGRLKELFEKGIK